MVLSIENPKDSIKKKKKKERNKTVGLVNSVKVDIWLNHFSVHKKLIQIHLHQKSNKYSSKITMRFFPISCV